MNLDLDEVLICGFQSSVVEKKKQSCPAALVDNFAKICISLFLFRLPERFGFTHYKDELLDVHLVEPQVFRLLGVAEVQ